MDLWVGMDLLDLMDEQRRRPAALAQAGAAVTLVGRDPNRAAEIVTQMNAAAPAGSSPQHSFVACDCFQLANVATCAAQLTAASASGKLDFLVLTQGMATTQGRTDTPDGLDQKLTLHYFSLRSQSI